MTRQTAIKPPDPRRIVKAVTDAGWTVARVIVDGGRVEVVTTAAPPEPKDPFDLVDMRK